MALPKSIQAQVEQAEATLAAYAAPVEAQPAAPEPIEVMASPEVTPAPAPVPQPAPAQTTPSEDTWEHKFRSLQGLFNQQVPMLQGQVKDLTKRLDQAIGTLEQAKAAPKPQEQATQTVDPKDVENFGADLVDMVNRIAERRFGSVAQQVEAKFGELQKMLGTVEQRLEGTTQTVAVTAEQSFFDKLKVQVPEWEQINANPAFLAWLADSDPVYGVPRQRALDSAREQLDVGRIVSVFRAFAPATTVAPVVRNPVDRQVSPKAGANAPAPTAPSSTMYTQKQISDFYNDVARGKFKGREAEAQAIEQSVNTAIAEGRVR
jgi:uncharacterized protein YukE